MGLLVGLGLTSLPGAATHSALSLTFCRGLGGIAMGAYPPSVIPYLTDLLPPTQRGMLVFSAVAFATLGPPMGIFLVRYLTPLQPLGLQAWRWGLFFGGVGAALVGALFRFLPESPRWLHSRRLPARAEAACLAFESSRILLQPAVARAQPEVAAAVHAEQSSAPGKRLQAVVAAIFLLEPLGHSRLPDPDRRRARAEGRQALGHLADDRPVLVRSAARHAAGLDLDRSAGAALGLCAVATTIAGGCFVASDSQSWLVVAIVSFSLFSALYVPTLTMCGAELLATVAQARSIASARAFNRIGAAIAPLLRSSGAITMFAVIAATLLLSIVLLGFAPRGRQRLSVS